MAKTIKTKILLRNDLAANWTSNNPILGKGQMGVEIDTKKFKFGDGVKHWNELGYGAGADIANASASSDGLMSSSDFSKLAGIEAGAEANIIQKIQKNGTDLTITNKTVNITVPTKTSDITNDSGFITTADIPEGAAASTTTPKMDGTAAVGTELAFARGDHVHPSDTSRVPTTRKVNGKALSADISLTASDVGALPDNTVIPGATITTPKMDGTAAVGTETKWAKGDHVHPTDTSRAPVASPAFTGTPTAPTASSATNDTQIATTAFVHSVVTDAIDDVTQFDYEVVTNLPATGTKGKIYLVAHTHGDRDVYDEYIWVGSTYEKIGNTDIDLTNYLQSVTVAGQTLTPSNNSVTAAQIKSAMSLGAAADKAVDTTIPSTPGANLPTSAAVATYVSNNSTKVTSSATNGNIKINNVETTVYTLPSTVVDSSDILILDCGNSTTNYA